MRRHSPSASSSSATSGDSGGVIVVSSRASNASTHGSAPPLSEASTADPLGAGLATAQPSAPHTPVGHVLSVSPRTPARLDAASIRLLNTPDARVGGEDTRAALLHTSHNSNDGAALHQQPQQPRRRRRSRPPPPTVPPPRTTRTPTDELGASTHHHHHRDSRREGSSPPRIDVMAVGVDSPVDQRRDEPQRRRPSQSVGTTGLVESAQTPSPPRSGGAVVTPHRRDTPRGAAAGRRSGTWQEDDEVAQLARSLRSEIAGQLFLLTPPFDPAAAAAAAAATTTATTAAVLSRHPSSYSELSSTSRGGGGGGGGSGRRRTRLSSSFSSGAAAAAGAEENALVAGGAVGGHSPGALLCSPASSAATPTDLHSSSGAAAAVARSPTTTPPLHSVPPPWLVSPPCSPPMPPLAEHRADVVEDVATVTPPTPAAAVQTSRSPPPPPPPPTRPLPPSHAVAAPAVSSGAAGHRQSSTRDASEVTEEGFDAALSNVAELRRRLLTEDFFSSPFRKLRRDGRFPWKLTTSVVLCLLLLVQVVWYQVPLARANAAMRLAITERFMGDVDSYFSKDQGDIVAAPTQWMEGLYTSVEHYVGVYYDLSNTSSSDMNYYSSNPNYTNLCVAGGAATLASEPPRQWGWWWWGRGGPGLAVNVSSIDAAGTPCPPEAETTPSYIPVADIAPVLMRVEVDVFSRREGAQHTRTRASPLDTVSPVRLVRRADDLVAGAENAERRWLTFTVDAEHPLGPFAKYKEAARLLRRARLRERRRAAKQRKHSADASGYPPSDKPDNEEADGAAAAAEGAAPRHGGSVTAVDAALMMVCQPRYDELRGRLYRPCASTQTAAPEKDDEEKDEAEAAATRVVPEFSLMDNVRRIQLEVTLRHELDAVDTRANAAAGALGADAAAGARTAAGGAAGGAKEFGAGRRSPRNVSSSSPLLGGRASAVFQWRIVKDITIHPGGLVETQLRVATRVWPVSPSPHVLPPHLLAVLLGALAVLELVLRVRALQRIAQYRQRLRRERVAFIVRQQRLHQQRQAERAEAEEEEEEEEQEEEEAEVVVAPASDGSPAESVESQLQPPPVGIATTAPYEWGLPGSPAAGHPSWRRGSHSRAALLGAQRAPTYGTMGGHHRLQATSQPPALVTDTSFSILAVTPQYSGGGGDAAVMPSSPLLGEARGSAAGRSGVGCDAEGGVWLVRALRRLLPHRLARLCGSPTSPPGYALPDGSLLSSPCSPVRAVLTPRGSFPSARRPALTRHLSERIMERSYVDVRTTWRHHLQQSMGAGWHWVAIAAAATTLSYSALLLAPLLPFLEVAQSGVYDAWTSVLLGVASLLSCVLLLSYLRFFPTLYFPVMASVKVVPKLFMFGVCVSPLFFGFVVFFVIAFGAHSNGHFESMGWASIGLYFITYGDSLLSTVEVAADTPYAATAVVASVMVLCFVLIFMMIMLNMAMTITQHEWLRLRRRFGAALSTSSLLFAVRSRAEVKLEAVQAVRTNLEVLWFMLAEDEREERQRAAEAEAETEAHAADAAPSTSSTRSRGSGGDEVWLSPLAMSPDPSYSTTTNTAGGRDAGDGAPRRLRHRRQHRHSSHPTRRTRGGEADRYVSGSVSGSRAAMVSTVGSSYDVSAATTVPPD